MNFTGLLDMIDGGGAGRAGQQFEGARVSEILNAIGIKPYGAEDRMRAVRPQARPDDFRQQFAPPIQAPRPQQPAMSPMDMFGGMPPAPYSPPQQSPMQMLGGMPPAPYSPQMDPQQQAIMDYLISIGVNPNTMR
jgi:hypothetical protein